MKKDIINKNIKTILKKILETSYKLKINKNVFMIYLVMSLTLLFPMQIGFSADKIEQVQTKKQVDNMCLGTNPFNDPRDSIILSVLTLCLPGVLEKVERMQEIKCDEVICEYEASKIGVDMSYCASEKAYNTCMDIQGELFALPGFHTLEHIRKVIGDALANPKGFAFGIGVSMARVSVTGSCSAMMPAFMCNAATDIPLGVSAPIVFVVDAMFVVETIKQMFENGFSFGTDSSCDDISSIKSELDKIVKATEVSE